MMKLDVNNKVKAPYFPDHQLLWRREHERGDQKVTRVEAKRGDKRRPKGDASGGLMMGLIGLRSRLQLLRTPSIGQHQVPFLHGSRGCCLKAPRLAGVKVKERGDLGPLSE